MPRGCNLGRPSPRNVLSSFDPGPVRQSSLSGDTDLKYFKLLLDDSMTKEIVEKTNACLRFIRHCIKQQTTATFEDTCDCAMTKC